MRRGHIRTHSATLAHPLDYAHPPSTLDEPSLGHYPLEILLLLDKSLAKAKESVCSVESLHIDLQHYPRHLFVFGKGALRKEAGLARKMEERLSALQVIAEGGQQLSRKQKNMKPKQDAKRQTNGDTTGSSSCSSYTGVFLQQGVNKALKPVRSPHICLKYRERHSKTLASLKQPRFGMKQCLGGKKGWRQ